MGGPPVARIGDDSFGSPHCHSVHPWSPVPHPVKGPIISGEMTVMMEGSPCARMGDNGVHTMTCCGPNTYMITKGSGTVIVGKKPASRIGDSTLHCGMASGNIIKGAGTVMVGG